MANKKITDLTLRSDFDETCNVPVDDTSQTWRTTGAQIAAFVRGATSLWAGIFTSYSWTNTVSASIVDWVNGTVGTFTETFNQGFGTVTAAASDLPGITFTPESVDAVYVVMAKPAAWDNTNNIANQMFLTDGSTTIATGAVAGTTGASEPVHVTIMGLYKPATVSPVTVKLMAKRDAAGGTSFIDGGPNTIEWMLIRIA